MSTDTLEHVDVTTTNDGDHDKFAHYFARKDLDRALFDGVEVTALCGKTTRPLAGIEGRTVCPPCKEIYDQMIKE